MVENPHLRRIDATASYQIDLDNKITQLFPFVDSRNSPIFTQYQSGECHFVSFNPMKQPLAKEILQIALQKASDKTNGATFSVHGSQHEVFPETINKLSDSIRKGKIQTQFQTMFEEVKCGSKSEVFSIERLVIEGERYERNVHRPLSHQIAKKLPNERNGYAKIIRNLAVADGIPLGVLVGLYKGLEPTEIFDILGNKNFINSLPSRNKTLHPSHFDDVRMLTSLSKTLQVITPEGRFPVMSADAYDSALNILRAYKWDVTQHTAGTNYGFADVTEKPFPRAVFAGMVQVAQETACTDFKDPARTEYIYRKHEGVTTTKLITAFLVYDK